jgi:hypothetical protein
MNASSEPISVGCQVELELVNRSGEKERMKIVIAPDNAADYTQGYISEKTPLARILLSERAGTIIPYLKDDILSIEIISVSSKMNMLATDAVEKRRATMEKTRWAIEDTNAMIFASSFSGKWGDYDPDSIPKEKENDPDDYEIEDG